MSRRRERGGRVAPLVVALALAGCSGTDAPSETLSGRVTFVVDGDTVHVDVGGRREKVRLIGIDTPERGEPGFDAATDALRRRIDGRAVRLVLDRRAGRRDRFGRLLAYVEVGGVDAGERQVCDGLAEILVVGAGFERRARYEECG